MAMGTDAEAYGYFDGVAGSLYGAFYRAQPGPARVAVLMASPYGEERKCGLRLMVEAARALAGAGVDVLRFDYRGAGESLGAETPSLADWVADSEAALRLLERLSEASRRVVLGARLGGNIALQVRGCAGRVLWAPLVNGDAAVAELVRRKQIKEMYGSGRAGSGDDGVEAAWQRGRAVDFDGFLMGSALAAELRALRLEEALRLQRNAAIPTLVIQVSGARQAEGAWAAVSGLCAEVAGWDYELLRQRPFWGRLDYARSEELIGETVAFCQRLAEA